MRVHNWRRRRRLTFGRPSRTGLKALPHAKLPVHGDVLHDSHAEVIARRGFHLWTYAQIERARKADAEKGKAPETESEEEEASYFERDSSGCWCLRPEWHVAFYVSTLPCTFDTPRSPAP